MIQTAQYATIRQKDLWQLGVLPIMMLGALSNLIGVYWDIAWHIDIGRDTFFTMPHNFIYAGMLLMLMTTAWGLVVDRRQTRFHWKIGRLWLNSGLLVALLGAGLILFFAPADELWHRFYGLDATLWGPMHLIGLTGTVCFTFATVLLVWLERQIAIPKRQIFFERLGLVITAIFLGKLMLFLAEYEFNTTQFPADFHPLLLAALSTLPLLFIAKIYPRAWGASKVVLVFTGIRLLMHLWLMVTNSQGLAGESKPVFPILIFSALLVDLLHKRLPTWLVGIPTAMVTLTVGYLVNISFWQMQWTLPVLVRGGLVGVALAIGAALLGQRLAQTLSRNV